MLKEACNHTLPAPECLSPNYTVPWDSSKPLFKATEEIYKVTVAILATPITCIGLITSLLCTILFLCYPITQRTTRLLLIVNSVIDTCYLAMMTISRMVIEFLPVGGRKVLYMEIFDGISNYLALFRNWTIVLIAFERYMLVCHPLILKSKTTDKWTEKALIGVSLCTILIRMPTTLTIIFKARELCNAAVIAFSIDGFADITFLTIIPLVTLTTFTVMIQIQTRRLQRWRTAQCACDGKCKIAFERMNKRVHRTIMIVLISFAILMIPFLPNGLFRILIAFGNDSCWAYLGRHITAAMSYVGSLLNSTINCFIYLLTWSKFRKCLLRMILVPFICDAKRKAQRSVSVDNSRTEPQTRQQCTTAGDF